MFGKRIDYAVVRSKIKRETYLDLLQYCKMEHTNISRFVRSLIESNVGGVIPINQAGVNRIEYNKSLDSFSWFLDFDNGPKVLLAENLQPEFFENLIKASESAVEFREIYLKKKVSDSVPIPKIKKLIGGKWNVE